MLKNCSARFLVGRSRAPEAPCSLSLDPNAAIVNQLRRSLRSLNRFATNSCFGAASGEARQKCRSICGRPITLIGASEDSSCDLEAGPKRRVEKVLTNSPACGPVALRLWCKPCVLQLFPAGVEGLFPQAAGSCYRQRAQTPVSSKVPLARTYRQRQAKK